MNILITGGVGFIGMHTALKLKAEGYNIISLDNMNNFYYDNQLKKDRRDILFKNNISNHVVDLALNSAQRHLRTILHDEKIDLVIHLAAHAGVRHSLNKSMEYIQNNIVATQNLIDACKLTNVENVIYASTSCVMAGNALPWKEDTSINHQLNPYGFTKYTNECQFKVSHHIKRKIGLRFFTVYGPWGRPDMALFKFSKAAVENEKIDVYNYGNMKRDFTYIDDIVAGISCLVKEIYSYSEYDNIYNIGYGEQVQLMDFISEIEKNFNCTIEKNLCERHPADTLETWSDTTKLRSLGWKPTTSIKDGVKNFTDWYKSYYGVVN